ncbi:chemotaxis protein CheB [Desulfobacterales bacterium HSG16]|nr:chemotaxis protein CheB [Desulfobacterales bacterium HSG16]
MKDPIRLLIVDDSKLMRQVIHKIFESSDRIHVVGEATNGKEALKLIPELNPSVVTLDINMPEMDGLTTLKHMMIRYPRPAVMCSTLTKEGSQETFDALKYGAVDFIHKPSNSRPMSLKDQCLRILHKISLAAEVEISAIRLARMKSGKKTETESKSLSCRHVCAIGAAEGGFSPLLKIIPHLRPDLPAAYIVMQHEQPFHVDAFAKYLSRYSACRVKRARNGDLVSAGVCYLASGLEYVTLKRTRGVITLEVHESPFPEKRGAINMLMLSVADIVRSRSMGIILSGADKDGSEGICEIIRNQGAGIIQDPKTCLHKESSNYAAKNCNKALMLTDAKIAAFINKKCQQ